MKILIAEDELISRKLLARTLSQWGHDVSVACDGQEAWEIFQSEGMYFVISDWMMPRMDGIELCKQIRRQCEDRLVYIILLTAKNSKEDIVLGMEAGADDFISKPFDPNELLARVRAGERVLKLEARLIDATKLEGIQQTAVTLQHEINNPLVGIMGNAELLKMTLTNSAQNVNSLDTKNIIALADEIVQMSERISDVMEKLRHLYQPVLALHPVGDNLSVEMIDLHGSK